MAGLAVTFNNNTTQSTSVDLQGLCCVGVFVPAGFDGTSLTFQTSLDDVAYVDVQDGAGAAYTVTVAASKYVPLDPSVMVGVRYLKITSGTTQTPEVEMTLATRQV